MALSDPTALFEVLSVEGGAAEEDGAVVAPSAAPPTEVRAEGKVAAEPEQSMAALVVPLVEPSRAQSSSNFSVFSSVGLPTENQRKAPMTSTDDGSLVGHPILFDIKISEGESVLANPILAKWLIQAALLPTDRENRKNRTVAEIFSSFYLMMLRVSFPTHFLFFFHLI